MGRTSYFTIATRFAQNSKTYERVVNRAAPAKRLKKKDKLVGITMVKRTIFKSRMRKMNAYRISAAKKSKSSGFASPKMIRLTRTYDKTESAENKNDHKMLAFR